MIIDTTIEGLKIRVNKVVSDDRGVLCELSKGSDDEFLKEGIKNIYASIATGKHVARAGHYHFRNVENFFTLSGTALWYFKDYRKDSKTHNNTFKIILGFKGLDKLSNKIDSITIDKTKMAQILVPNGVYHIFWPLTDEPTTVLALASEAYDKEDYWRADDVEMEEMQKNFEEVVK